MRLLSQLSTPASGFLDTGATKHISGLVDDIITLNPTNGFVRIVGDTKLLAH
jgi:hypothetical protein